MVAIQTGSPVSSRSPTTVGPSIPAPPKGGKTDICGVAQLPITNKTRSIPSAQTMRVSVLGGTREGGRLSVLAVHTLLCASSQSVIPRLHGNYSFDLFEPTANPLAEAGSFHVP
jgi:hypothetical protein